MARRRETRSKSSREKTKTPYPSEVKGVALLATSLIMTLSLVSFTDGNAATNFLGLLGFTFAWVTQYLFGLGSYLIVLFISWIGWRFLKGNPIENLLSKSLYFFLTLASACILLNLMAEVYPEAGEFVSPLIYSEAVTYYAPIPYRVVRHNMGGVPFYYLYRDLPMANLQYLLSNVGTTLICLTGFTIGLMMMTDGKASTFVALKDRLTTLRKKMRQKLTSLFEREASDKSFSDEEDRFVKVRVDEQENEKASQKNNLMAIKPETELKERPSISRKESRENPQAKIKVAHEEGCSAEQSLLRHRPAYAASDASIDNFEVPGHSLITSAKKIDQPALKKSLRRQAEVLEETLLSFGIDAKVGEINCGPTITSFEVHPAIGVKVQRIKALENDIALNLEAQSIRIIAPIPGKAAVGIEVPNPFPQEVGFKEMLHSYRQGPQKYSIPILLGKTVHGTHITADLTKMPHCIIAGATGSGKSVCINTIIMSILMNARPDQIKLLMVDPKKVELTPYTKLPHMIAPVITEPFGASAALNWLVKEMELRYEILKQLGLRNIAGFNKRKVDKQMESSLTIPIPENMPFIVGIIDELADLMMVSSSDIETPIARIAQMARAVGIHLILATQRPSREVITGLIKANFPTRIAFKVASRINSQIILDESGAESLLGNGDMLFLPPGSSNLVRAQGAYIRDEDINKVVNSICQQAPTNYLIKSFDAPEAGAGFGSNSNSDQQFDNLYNQARDIVLETGNASTTFLQRKLKVGYARAASLMDQLESMGIVGPPEGSKSRKILVKTSKNDPDSKDD
ncbi:MAG: S-DNA-T family DNA segregation ATPase FtsK/SpoIIIE [Chlamydiales bacterium]|jgi:S-DNA-T family DNA segregation ATPase FtsK/SpoIIIE